ncbi:MFS transporter [Actinoplanes friuliensis]|uniref:Major facilitator transporter n=1 Tax=Actinoplanes friuliensis DSM 7358 TaxID=1246995 RepID=U5W2A0_9ACTN|nr:MFS transporter [Actinoplanes friuliensis]AGZ43137.1 major facilitator transporter [Actinoplanes friuliensis DSM 7358]
MSALADLRPLRESPPFRRLWLGTTASGFGGQLGAFAVVYYVWEHTRSAAMVGLVGLVTAVPMIVLALAGSAFMDHVDRRLLAFRCSCGQLVVSLGMAAVAATDIGGVPLMLVLAGLGSAFASVGGPAKRTFIPALLTGDRLAAGLALSHLSFQLAMLLGPATAGLVTAQWGTTWCFVIDAVTFAFALIGIAGLPRGVESAEGRPGAAAVVDGFRFTARTPEVRGAFLADLAATMLAMPFALFPLINAEKFGGRPEILGLFTTAVAVGGVLASVLSGLATRRRHPGTVLLVCGTVWAVSLGFVGLTGHLLIVLSLLAVAGAADTWAVVSRGTVVQTATPVAYRGRVASLEHIVGSAGPELGNLRAGLVATVTSGAASLALGGILSVIATGLIAVTTPALRRFTVPEVEPEMHDRSAGVPGA